MQIDLRKLQVGQHVGLGVLVECPRCRRPGVRRKAVKNDRYTHTVVLHDREVKLKPEKPDPRNPTLFDLGERRNTLPDTRQEVVTECVVPIGFDWKEESPTRHGCSFEDAELTVTADRMGGSAGWSLRFRDGRPGGQRSGKGCKDVFEAKRLCEMAYMEKR